MKVLIPLLSKNELNEEFLDKAVKGANEVILLMVIDKEDSLKASDISSSTHFLEEVKKAVGKKRKKCEDLTEWGETTAKIKSIAIINKADKIALLKQENQFFEKLVEKLGEEKQLKNRIQIIKVDLEKAKEEEKQKEKESQEKTSKESEKEKPTQKLTEREEIKQIKSITDKVIKQGFKGIDSIKKIQWK